MPRLFPPGEERKWEKSIRRCQTAGKSHKREEKRILEATSILNGYLKDWPRVEQVFRLRRWRAGVEEPAYGITSLPEKSASPESLLAISRRHWAIENSLHYVRDVTLREDFCRTRNRHKAQTLAAFRNTVIALTRRQGFSCIPEGLEYFAEHRTQAIHAITTIRKRTE